MVCTRNVADNFDINVEPYMKDVTTGSHLPVAEQAEYIRAYHETGDTEYKDIIIETNMLFVVSVAKKFHSTKLALSDKVSAGMVGLMQAVEKFDPDNGASFITYARWWVEQSIRKEVMAYANVVRIPVGTYRQMKEIQGLANEGWSNDALEKTYNMSAKKISLLKISGKEVSMSQTLNDDGFTIQDTLAGSASADAELSQSDEYRFLLSKVELLNDRERLIVKMRFGIEDGKSKTLQEISEIYSITRERIRQIINRALRKLRDLCEYKVAQAF